MIRAMLRHSYRSERSTSTTLTATAATALAALAALALALAPPAVAHRAPTPSEKAAISRALHASPATRAVKCFHVHGVVIASGGQWARALVTACNPQRADTALSVLQKRGGRWRVRDLGTSGVGCTVAPARVQRDLHLICPG